MSQQVHEFTHRDAFVGKTNDIKAIEFILNNPGCVNLQIRKFLGITSGALTNLMQRLNKSGELVIEHISGDRNAHYHCKAGAVERYVELTRRYCTCGAVVEALLNGRQNPIARCKRCVKKYGEGVRPIPDKAKCTRCGIGCWESAAAAAKMGFVRFANELFDPTVQQRIGDHCVSCVRELDAAGGRTATRFVAAVACADACKICRDLPVSVGGRCQTCYNYLRNNGIERPRHLIDKARNSRQIRAFAKFTGASL